MPPHPDQPAERSEHGKTSLKGGKRWWNVFKKWKEGQESDWWFASTGIP
jgi:hypothetical protein